MCEKIYDISFGNIPLIATAIHNGHELRTEVKCLSGLDDLSRLREEDPFTGRWTEISDNHIVVQTSRFEVDLNRVRDKAVYATPEDAWGLNVWKTDLDPEMIRRSLEKYDLFYSEVHKVFSDLQSRFGKFVVYDLHSYNHRREGIGSNPAEPAQNPEVNIGTGTMDRKRWEPIVNRFIKDLSEYSYMGKSLDVRENVKFLGGNFAKWTHKQFPESACVLSIEFKKFFMDEWTGKPDKEQVKEIYRALKSTMPGVLKELR